MTLSWSSASPQPSTLPSTVHPEEADFPVRQRRGKPIQWRKRVTALAIFQRPPAHDQSTMICWRKMERDVVRSHRKELILRSTAPRHIPRSRRSSEDQDQNQVQAEVIPRSFGNQQTRLPSCH